MSLGATTDEIVKQVTPFASRLTRHTIPELSSRAQRVTEGTPSEVTPQLPFWSWAVVLCSLSILLFSACMGSLPPLEEQKAQILRDDIRINVLTRAAFLEAWGPPTYDRRERTQFFLVKNGMYVPRFRVPLGEYPDDWNFAVVPDWGEFFAYAERGELLGFIEDRLVYREQMTSEEVHALGQHWEKEELTKTRLERELMLSH